MDLIKRLCRALNIARNAVERLALTGYTDVEEPRLNLRPEKIISETAFLLLAASAYGPDDEVMEHIRSVADVLIPHARSERMLLGACLKPALALDYAQAHVCLTRLGYSDPRVDTLLRLSRRSQAKSGVERTPHRQLEQEWLERGWRKVRSRKQSPVSRAALTSVLNHPMDLLQGSQDDVYAFTHAIMYMADFNISPQRFPRPVETILAEAEVALARCLDDQDYDLGGEVLLAWPLISKSWSSGSAFGFRVLACVEDQAGFLPAPNTRLDCLNKLQGDDRANYLVASAYHTAYVMGLLSAVALQPGRAPPSRIPTDNRLQGSSNQILQVLDDGGFSVHWREEFNQLTESERDAISGLLLSIALRRKVNQREFGAVHRLLQIGNFIGLSNSPVASQTAELLERLAAFNTFTRPS